MIEKLRVRKLKNWIVPIIGVFLYFILIIYLRLLLIEADGNIFKKLIEDFFINLPVLSINITLIYYGVKTLNKYFFENLLLKFALELIYAIIITLILIFIMGAIVFITKHHNESFNLEYHINPFGHTFVMALLIGIFTITILETHYQHKINKQKKIDFEAIQQENLKLKYIQLKNQINPHFLFNSLSILTALTRIDQDKAIEFIQKLSETYRYVLFQDQKDLVPLDQEVSFIQSFLDILKTRFDEGLEVTMRIQDISLKKNIIPMTLQLLIENAVKHNIVDKNSPLHIIIESHEDYITVSNNLNPKIIVQRNHKVGLNSIKKRYRILDKHTDVYVSKTNSHFIVKIPLL